MKRAVKISLLCAGAVVGNMATSYLASVLKLPCFLDTIFSVAITFYAGLVPGIIVAAVFNPLMTIFRGLVTSTVISYYDFLYAICGMLIVLATWFFSRKKSNFSFNRYVTVLYLLIIAFSSALLSCLSASALDTYVLPLFVSSSGFSSFDTVSLVFQQMRFGTFISYLLPRIPLTVLDRIICTFTGFGVYKLFVRIEKGRMQ